MSDDIIPVILSAPHTAMLNVLTSTRIYCFYPALLRRGENLIISSNRDRQDTNAHNGFRAFNFGLRSYASTEDWHFQGRQCVDQCPALWRSVKGLRGVGIMQWGGISEPITQDTHAPCSDGFEYSEFIWKLQGVCLNRSCPNWRRGGSIDDIISIYNRLY